MNTYGYVGAHPLKYSDPYGLTANGAAVGAAIGSVVGGTLGAVGGGAVGTLATPAGTIAGGVAGGTQGAIEGAVIGGIIGNEISNIYNSIFGDTGLSGTNAANDSNSCSDGEDPCERIFQELTADKNELLRDVAFIRSLRGRPTSLLSLARFRRDTLKRIRSTNEAIDTYNSFQCPKKITPIPEVI